MYLIAIINNKTHKTTYIKNKYTNKDRIFRTKITVKFFIDANKCKYKDSKLNIVEQYRR